MAKDYKDNETEENPFSMSVGDLMSGLLFIFILLLSYTMLRVQEKSESDAKVTQEYNQVKIHLYNDLYEEFKDSLKVWEADIDKEELSVRFQEPKTLFDVNEAKLQPKFKRILNDFFPRYIKVLSKDQYRNNIEEIRIEGHTDSSGKYFHNMKLSQDRTRAVLEYCYNLLNDSTQSWVQSKATANGLSYSHTILKNDGSGEEDSIRSRRVEFRIRTNAEKILEQVANNCK